MLTLITGGSGSGKSEYAEQYIVDLYRKVIFSNEITNDTNTLYYVATMIPRDEEAYKKVDRHQRMRCERGFKTLEVPMDLSEIGTKEKGCFLLECMSNLCANLMFESHMSKEEIKEQVISEIQRIKEFHYHICIVTNEIFSDGMELEGEMLDYVSCLGELNQMLAQLAEQVIEVVVGIPILKKGAMIE